MTALLLAVALTTAIEAVVYRALIAKRFGAAVAASAAINLITVAPANLAWLHLVASLTPPPIAFGVVEAIVILAEIPLLRIVAAAPWRRSVLTSVVANACSMALSAMF